MSIENVRCCLKKSGYDTKIIELPQSSATVPLAAEALHTDPDRIAKTLAFLVDEKPIVIVVAGMRKIDNAKYRHHFGTKAKMISPDQLPDLVGHEMGGVCPFAVKPDVRIYLDESLKDYETVFPACGSSNSAIELKILELETLASPCEWIQVSKSTAGEN